MGQTRHLHYTLSNSRVPGAVSIVRKVVVFQVLVMATDLGNGAWGPLGNSLARLLCYRPVSEPLVGPELHPDFKLNTHRSALCSSLLRNRWEGG